MSKLLGFTRRGVGRRHRRAFVLACLMAAWLGVPASASAAPTVTFIAPPGARSYPDHFSEGPVPYTEAATALRTTDQRPRIEIEANGGTSLVCYLDDVHTPVPCGSSPPGCPTTLCAVFQPSTPLGPDSSQFTRGHFLAVDVDDSGGNPLAQMWLNIDVDTNPPVTTVNTAHGVLTLPLGGSPPLRPSFTYEVTDSNSVGTNVDTARCSWAPAGKPTEFHACTARPGSHSIGPGPLARRHRLYRLEVRGTDDFGRSTTASGVFDPIPCVLSIRRPASVASLLSSGVKTRLRCDTVRHVTVAAYAFMVNGQRSATPRGAVSDNPILGQYKVASRTGTINASKRLRLFGGARSALRHAHSIGLVLAAGDPDKILAGIADDSLSYQVVTLRR